MRTIRNRIEGVYLAQQALEEAVAYVQERRQFDTAIADFQATQFKLADMLTELVAARQMVRLAAHKLPIKTRFVTRKEQL